jgi:hypothetical protein
MSIQVHGANISVGTAIAKFSRGKYYGQTAIYFSQSTAGIQVWSQVKILNNKMLIYIYVIFLDGSSSCFTMEYLLV